MRQRAATLDGLELALELRDLLLGFGELALQLELRLAQSVRGVLDALLARFAAANELLKPEDLKIAIGDHLRELRGRGPRLGRQLGGVRLGQRLDLAGVGLVALGGGPDRFALERRD